MDIATIMQAIKDITGHQWMPLAILIIGYLVTLTSDVSKFPVTVPARWKPVIVLVLGQAYAVLQNINGGEKWQSAVYHGLLTSFATMGLFDLVINGIFNGNLPKWLAWLAFFDKKLVAAKAQGATIDAPLVGTRKTSVPPPPAT
jgi:hypothetical protein